MLTPKKKIKISQKNLKQDELVDFVEKMSLWYYQNQKNVTTIAIALVIVVGGLFYYSYNVRSNNEKASAQLGKVYSLYDNAQYKEAAEGVPERNIPGLKTISDNFSGSDAGEIARLYLANCYYNMGNIDEAQKQYDGCSISEPQLKAAVAAGLAACAEAKKNYAEAGEHFRKAAGLNPTGPNAAEYLYNAGRNFGLAGQKDNALEVLKRLKKEFQTSQQARDADRYITQYAG